MTDAGSSADNNLSVPTQKRAIASIGSSSSSPVKESLLPNKSDEKVDKTQAYEKYKEIKKDQVGSLNRMLALAAFGVSIGLSLPHGFHTGALNPQEEWIKIFLNQSYTDRYSSQPSVAMLDLLWSLAVSVYLVGGMAGALSFGIISDKLGRKRSAYLFLLIGFIGSALFIVCQLTQLFELLLLARVIVGFGCGAGSGLSPMFLTEIAPVNIRGGMGVLHQLMLTIGILLSQLLGLNFIMGKQHLLGYLFACGCLPSIICLIILPFIPDSPRYLLVQLNDEQQAESALKRYRLTQNVSAALLELRMDRRRAELQPAWSIRKILAKRSFRLPLLLVVVANVAQQLSGINVAFYYSRGILERAGIPSGSVQYAVLAIGTINVAMTGVSVMLVDKFGRKPLLLISLAGMFIAACLLTAALNLLQWLALGWMAYLATLSMVAFVILFAIGLGCIPQFLGSELFLTGPRPAAMALAAFGNWLANWLVGLLFPFMALLLGNWCFAPFLIFLSSSFIILFIKLPETKGVTAEELASRFGTDSGMPKVNSHSSNMIELISDHLIGANNQPLPYTDKDVQDYIASQNSLKMDV